MSGRIVVILLLVSTLIGCNNQPRNKVATSHADTNPAISTKKPPSVGDKRSELVRVDKQNDNFRSKEGDELEVYALIIKSMIDARVNDPKELLCFIEIDNNDPEDALLLHLGDLEHRLRRVSQSEQIMGATSSGGIRRDMLSKQRGILLRVRRLRWINEHTIQLQGDCIENRRNGYGDKYTVELKAGKWTVSAKQHNLDI